MAYFYDMKTSGKDIPVRCITGSTGSLQPSIIHASYSFRTRRKPAGVLALGELRLNQNLGSVSDYLKAEQTAIMELNSELEESSNLNEGTWGLRDAGHVFSSIRQTRRALHYQYGWGSYIGPESHDCAWYSREVDPVTANVWGFNPRQSHPAWDVVSTLGISMQDVTRQASELLWKTDPDVISGSVGQDLVDLAQLPHLFLHLKNLASAMGGLKNKWDRLDRDVQESVDLLFQRDSSKLARQRKLKRLRNLPKRSLSKGSAAYLEWEFVLSPYIDDIRLLLRVLGQASGASIVTTRRSRTSRENRVSGHDGPADSAIVPTGRDSSNVGFSGAIWPSNSHGWYALRYDISVHAKWSLKGATLDPFVKRAVDLNQQLGVIYPSMLWDLMPWTFLIDWFLHIGTSIDRVVYLNNGRYTPVYAWATIKGSSGVGWDAPPTPFYRNKESIICPWPGMPTTSWTTRFPVSLSGGIKPGWGSLTSSTRKLLTALGFSRLK